MDSNLKNIKIIKAYKYDNETFVVHDNRDNFEFDYYKSSKYNKWRLGIYKAGSGAKIAPIFGKTNSDLLDLPYFRCYKSPITNRIFIEIGDSKSDEHGFIINDISDDQNSRFLKRKRTNTLYSWNTVIELDEGESYTLYLNNEPYEFTWDFFNSLSDNLFVE